MNLWIRTQNRMRLFNISLDISILEVHDKNEKIKHYMLGCNDYEMDYQLGIYKTKERALEVMDEINNVKWWKYMASLNFEIFIKTLEEKYNEEEKKEIFKMMNTYEMPLE